MKRKFEEIVQLFVERTKWNALLILTWVVVSPIALTVIAFGQMYIKGIVTVIWSLFTLFVFKVVKELEDRRQEKEAKDKNLQLQELKQTYASYISLVDIELEKIVEKNELKEKKEEGIITISTDYEYVFFLNDCYKWVCQKRNNGKADTFIMAACLMLSIVERPIIVVNQMCEEWEALYPNVKLAMNCAYKLISEPITYYNDNAGEWIEERHEKVLINIPKGIIKDNNLSDRIEMNFLRDYMDNKISIMQIADMLHLLYLYCRENNK